MDILTVLEAAHAPLTLPEIKEFSGLMFSDDRLDQLVRSGDVKAVPEISDTYYAVPTQLRKRKATRPFSPSKGQNKSEIIKSLTEYRTTLQNVSSELEELLKKKDSFPTEDQLKAHMNRLHKYNDAKDLGVLLLGHLAELEGVKVQTLYEDYGLGPDD